MKKFLLTFTLLFLFIGAASGMQPDNQQPVAFNERWFALFKHSKLIAMVDHKKMLPLFINSELVKSFEGGGQEEMSCDLEQLPTDIICYCILDDHHFYLRELLSLAVCGKGFASTVLAYLRRPKDKTSRLRIHFDKWLLREEKGRDAMCMFLSTYRNRRLSCEFGEFRLPEGGMHGGMRPWDLCGKNICVVAFYVTLPYISRNGDGRFANYNEMKSVVEEFFPNLEELTLPFYEVDCLESLMKRRNCSELKKFSLCEDIIDKLLNYGGDNTKQLLHASVDRRFFSFIQQVQALQHFYCNFAFSRTGLFFSEIASSIHKKYPSSSEKRKFFIGISSISLVTSRDGTPRCFKDLVRLFSCNGDVPTLIIKNDASACIFLKRLGSIVKHLPTLKTITVAYDIKDNMGVLPNGAPPTHHPKYFKTVTFDLN